MNDLGSYTHVIEGRRHLIDAPNDIRLKAIYDDVWVDYPLAERILSTVGTFLHMPVKTQAPCLLVSGKSGMGKTTLFEKIARKYGIVSGEPECAATLTLTVNDGRSHNAFCDSVVAALTSNIYQNHNVREECLVHTIRAQGIRVLTIDELNEMMLSNRLDIRKNLSYLKWLSGHPCSLSIVGMGTEECHNVVVSDIQMSRRFERIELSRWSETDIFRSFLATLETTLPLKSPSKLTHLESIRYLLGETGGVLDDVVKRINNAAGWAVLEDYEKVDLIMLEKGRDRPVF